MNNAGLHIESPTKIKLLKSEFHENGIKIYPKLITISNRVGIDKISPSIYCHMEYLMKHRTFCGMIGGTSGQAFYVLGFYNEKIIILDPHYVQPS